MTESSETIVVETCPLSLNSHRTIVV